jgi:hypothetical protein
VVEETRASWGEQATPATIRREGRGRARASEEDGESEVGRFGSTEQDQAS